MNDYILLYKDILYLIKSIYINVLIKQSNKDKCYMYC